MRKVVKVHYGKETALLSASYIHDENIEEFYRLIFLLAL